MEQFVGNRCATEGVPPLALPPPGARPLHPSGPMRMALFHSAYYLATGTWPLVHMPSFELVAGRKKDRWLVRTVGVLVTAVGAGIGLAQHRRELTPSMRSLAMLSAAGLAGIDLYYAGTGRIRRVYLADAAIELALALAWARSLVSEPGEASGRRAAVRPHNDEVTSPGGARS